VWRRDTLRSKVLRALLPERIPRFAAPLYDQIAHHAIETYYKEVAELVTAHVSKGWILDIGTGPGYLPIEIVKRASQIKVFGIDSSKELVRIAQANAKKAGVQKRVRLLKCDANKLEFREDSFQLVISAPPQLELDKASVRIVTRERRGYHEEAKKELHRRGEGSDSPEAPYRSGAGI
jgi:methylase of polypeptide subunit release factors